MHPILAKLVPGTIRIRLEQLLATPSFGNSLWLISDRLIRMGLGLLVGVWVARYLGPDGYGQLSFAGSYVMIFSMFALFGLDALVVRELVAFPGSKHLIMGTSIVMRTVTGFLAFGLSLLLLASISHDATLTALVLVLGSSLLFQPFEVIDLWFQHQVESRYAVVARTSAFVCSSVAKILVVVLGMGIVEIAFATALEGLLTAVMLVVLYCQQGGKVRGWRFSLEWAKKLLKHAFPLLLSGMVLMIYLRIDQVMLGMLSDKTEVGLYAAAVRIAEVWYFVPTVIISSLFPRLVELQGSDLPRFHENIQKLYSAMVFIGYAVAVPVTFLAPVIVTLLFGVTYQAAATQLSVLIWAGLFANISVARNAYLVANNMGRSMFWTTLSGAIINVLLNFVLIPSWGGLGASFATIISYWVAAHGACYSVKVLRPTAQMITRSLLCPKFW